LARFAAQNVPATPNGPAIQRGDHFADVDPARALGASTFGVSRPQTRTAAPTPATTNATVDTVPSVSPCSRRCAGDRLFYGDIEAVSTLLVESELARAVERAVGPLV